MFSILFVYVLQEDQSQLSVMTFRDLILVGQHLCSALITCLINRFVGCVCFSEPYNFSIGMNVDDSHLISSYLSDNASVDSVSAKLREICPKLYRNEDAACNKV